MDVELNSIGSPRTDESLAASSFLAMSDEEFARWSQVKLARAKRAAMGDSKVAIDCPTALSAKELLAIHSSIEFMGYALYKINNNQVELSAHDLLALMAQLGLQNLDRNRCAHDDGVSRIQNDLSGEQKHYIPYSNKALNWHTDGYYNDAENRIKAFALHCVRAADQGGYSLLLDHEMVYLALREYNPQCAKALCRDDAMAIPINSVDKENVRGEQVGPVFWQDPVSGRLQMRYTARTRSIRWNKDQLVQEGVAFIKALLQDSSAVKRYKLRAGEGIVSNNCLHARDSFDDEASVNGAGRLLLRARFFDGTQKIF